LFLSILNVAEASEYYQSVGSKYAM